MNSQVIDTIKDALNDITQLTPEKLQALVQDTLVAFQSIQAKVTSNDESEKEEGLKIAIELKAAMEEQVATLQKKLDMSPDQIEEYMANPANFSREEFKSMNESKKNLEQFKSEVEPKTVPISHKKKTRRQQLIVG